MDDILLHEALSAVKESSHYHDWVRDQFKSYLKKTDVVLDVGSGIGTIARSFKDCQFQKFILCDHNDKMFQVLQNEFGAKDRYQVVKADVCDENFPSLLRSHRVNVVSCVNVLEHIQDDDQALKNIYALLPKGGLLFLMVPALKILYGNLDRSVGHFRRYEKKTLTEKILRTGFSIKQQHFMNFFGIFSWFFAVKLFGQTKLNSKAMKRLDKMVPFFQTIEQYFSPPIGQSLIIICSKDG